MSDVSPVSNTPDELRERVLGRLLDIDLGGHDAPGTYGRLADAAIDAFSVVSANARMVGPLREFSMSPSDQVAYGQATFNAALAAPNDVVQRSLLLGLISSHGPWERSMQCLSKFNTEDGQPGCSECAQYGPPIRVEGRDYDPRAVWHVHLPPRDRRCASCHSDWPCAVIATIRSVLGLDQGGAS